MIETESPLAGTAGDEPGAAILQAVMAFINWNRDRAEPFVRPGYEHVVFDHLAHYAAAPVAAAPVDSLIAEMRNFADVADSCQITDGNAVAAIRSWADRLAASTPAAPGIDLEKFRPFVQPERDYIAGRIIRCDAIGTSERLAALQAKLSQCDHLLALIDASPKGGENMHDWSLRMAKLEEGQHVGAGAHGLQDSPKGGSDAQDAARWQHARKLLTIDDIELRQSMLKEGDFIICEKECAKADKAIDAAMQATSAEVGE